MTAIFRGIPIRVNHYMPDDRIVLAKDGLYVGQVFIDKAKSDGIEQAMDGVRCLDISKLPDPMDWPLPKFLTEHYVPLSERDSFWPVRR